MRERERQSTTTMRRRQRKRELKEERERKKRKREREKLASRRFAILTSAFAWSLDYLIGIPGFREDTKNA